MLFGGPFFFLTTNGLYSILPPNPDLLIPDNKSAVFYYPDLLMVDAGFLVKVVVTRTIKVVLKNNNKNDDDEELPEALQHLEKDLVLKIQNEIISLLNIISLGSYTCPNGYYDKSVKPTSHSKYALECP